ncbi:hypothetical protein BPTFM16_02114 [Altererythrobacter insulae]|nr:hypothetical protein BPTFM16_02114 [Altererythrobacter insulae]
MSGKNSTKTTMPPLALVLLLSFLSLPFGYYFWAKCDAPTRDEAVVGSQPVRGGTADPIATNGMAVSNDNWGTVLSAPARLVPMTSEDPTPVTSEGISADIAGFIRALPQIDEGGGPRVGPDGAMICTLEGPPVWRGTVELREGCVVFRDVRAEEPLSLLMISNPAIFRDDEGYLAIAAGMRSAEETIRFGEAGAVLTGHGCSRPNFLPAPSDLAQSCQVDRVINVARIARVPVCSQPEIARMDQVERDYMATERRIKATHDRCVAEGNDARDCPPPVIPYPYELSNPGCKMPGSLAEG